MSCWVILYSVILTCRGFYGSYGVKARVSLGEMKCWHLSWKSLGRGCVCTLWSNVRPTYGFRHVGVSDFRARLWGRSQAHHLELMAETESAC